MRRTPTVVWATPTTLKKVYLALGTNLGDRIKNLRLALSQLRERGVHILKVSKVYESPPHGFESQNLFLNLVLLAETFLSPQALFFEAKCVEFSLGRKRVQAYADREIDIDIIFFEDLIIDTEYLKIPHPRALERAFVMLPLLEIAPEFIHPGFGLPIKELAKNFEKSLNNQEIWEYKAIPEDFL
jgi:2-amino-4-hydroxy-6-hydroxymethyldihydropteridine diphosphokinase